MLDSVGAPSHFESIPELIIQGSVNFPLIKNIETKSFLSADRIQTDLVTTFTNPLMIPGICIFKEDISFNWQIKTTTRQVISLNQRLHGKIDVLTTKLFISRNFLV